MVASLRVVSSCVFSSFRVFAWAAAVEIAAASAALWATSSSVFCAVSAASRVNTKSGTTAGEPNGTSELSCSIGDLVSKSLGVSCTTGAAADLGADADADADAGV